MSNEYYRSVEDRIDTMVGDIDTVQYFTRLKNCKRKYDELADAVPLEQGFLTFEDYCREYWGIKISIDGDGIAGEMTVVDDQKYMMFVLKFSG